MGYEEYKQVLATTATISTILQFLTGVLICQKFMKKGSTGDVSGFPFVAGALGCSLWLRYGMMLDDYAMITVNCVGLMLQLSYVICYYLYCLQKSSINRQLVGAGSVITMCLVYMNYETDSSVAKYRLGLVACTTTLVFCAAPLTQLAQVIRTKSTEMLPFHLILATFLVAGQWFLYGVSIHDGFVQIPNLIGCLLAAFQLSLFAFYRSSIKKVQSPINIT